MSKKTMITYECDNCEATAPPEEMQKVNPIPEGWVEMSLTNNHGCIADLLLCEKCETVMRKAIHRRSAKK